MKEEQLELDLWSELQQAQQMPETVHMTQILNTMEVTAAQLPEAERLRFAGDALLQIADLYATRAGLLMSEWEAAYRDPIVQSGFFADLVRQTMAVDLSELMEPTPSRKPRTKQATSIETEKGSIVTTVDKAALLAMVDQLESEAVVEEEKNLQVWAIAYDENVSQWIEAITQTLQAIPEGQISFIHLCQRLGTPQVNIWLGLLLGGFDIQQQGEFYSNRLLIQLPQRG